jgi:Na+-transporting methylmalonyl-CoA/oxaloacetate decarboxylase gamma subunit
MSDFGIMDALKVTGVSMVLVFGLLVFLMLVIYVQNSLLKIFGKEKKKSQVVKVKENNIKEEAVDEVLVDENEIVAAIMAAISACIDVPQERLIVKSIKRVNSNNSAWGNRF